MLKFGLSDREIDEMLDAGGKLYLKCPKCGQVAAWNGYPRNPILSLVECLNCGHIATGASFEKAVKI